MSPLTTISASGPGRRGVLQGVCMAALSAAFTGVGVSSWAGPSQTFALPSPDGVWPQRRLLQPDLNATWEAHLLRLPVTQARTLPTMSMASAWSAGAPGAIAANGNAGLRISTPMLDPAMPISGRPTSYVRENGGAVYWRYKPSAPEDWSEFNRLRFRIRPANTGLASYRLVLALVSDGADRAATAPLPFHFLPGLVAGRWNEVVWDFAELPRNRITQFAILLPLLGPAGARAEYEIDGFELQRTALQPIEGWAVAPSLIACNQAGYGSGAVKRAVAAAGDDWFMLVDEKTGRGQRLPARQTTSRLGGFAELDFTAVSKPGRYRLEYGAARSAAFDIGEGQALGLVEPILNFFYADRCGHAVAGMHDACHPRLFAEHGGVRKAINGGWHDAGNLCQGAYRTTLATAALFGAFANLGPQLAPKTRERLLEEACWGLDWLLKTRFGHGVRVVNANFTVMQEPGDASDEFVVQAATAEFETFLFVETALQASRILHDLDPRRALAAKAAALEDFAAALTSLPPTPDRAGVQLVRAGDGANLPNPHEILAQGVLAAVEVHRTTGDEAAIATAVAFADRMIDHQDTLLSNAAGVTGDYTRDLSGMRRVTPTHTCFSETATRALEALIGAVPDHAKRSAWHAAAAIESECFLARGASTSAPFFIPPTAKWRTNDIEPFVGRAVAQIRFAEAFGAPDIAPSMDEAEIRTDLKAELEAGVLLAEGEWLRHFPIAEDRVFHGSGTIQLSRGLSLVAAGRLRKDAQLTHLGQLQLDWLLGRNPFAASLVYGVGAKHASQMLMWADDIVGAIPVGMDARRDRPFWPHTSHMTSREMWIVPAARALSLLTQLNAPARLTGTAGKGVVLRHDVTGRQTTASAGAYAMALPPGRYLVSTADGRRHAFTAIAGRDQVINLGAGSLGEGRLSASESGRDLLITASMTNADEGVVVLEASNLTVSAPRQSIKAGVAEWSVSVIDPRRPWVAMLRSPAGDLIADLVGPSVPADDWRATVGRRA